MPSQTSFNCFHRCSSARQRACCVIDVMCNLDLLLVDFPFQTSSISASNYCTCAHASLLYVHVCVCVHKWTPGAELTSCTTFGKASAASLILPLTCILHELLFHVQLTLPPPRGKVCKRRDE